MPKCLNCESVVTVAFVRVFGNNEREVYACPQCAGFSDMVGGGAAERRR